MDDSRLNVSGLSETMTTPIRNLGESQKPRTQSAMNPFETGRNIECRVWGSARENVWGSVYDSVHDLVDFSVRVNVASSVWGSVWGHVREVVRRESV